MVPFPRAFIYENRASCAIESASREWNIEDAINAIEWVVAHDPEFGELLNERGLRGFVYPGAVSIKEPDIDVLYEDRNPTILIHDLTFSQAKARYAGNA